MLFSHQHALFRESVRAFLEREVEPHVDAWEQAGGFDAHELFPKLAAAGLLGIEYEQEWGGQGGDHSFTVVFCEELGRTGSGVTMAIAVQTDMATPSLHRFGDDELKRRYLAPAMRGEQVAAVAITEPDAGSDVAELRTRAERDGDEWVVSGSKLYITNGCQADWVCLLARTSDEGGHRGMSQIVVPTDLPGFSVSRKLDKLGNRSSDTAELALDEVRVPVANTIGEIGRGFQQQMQQLAHERMVAAYRCVGASARARERTAAYQRARGGVGRPLIDHQHVRFRLAELAAELELVRSYCYAAAQAHLAGADISSFAAVAKMRAARMVPQVASTCLPWPGGVGVMAETWTARFFRDSRLATIAGGADEVMLHVIARDEGFESAASASRTPAMATTEGGERR